MLVLLIGSALLSPWGFEARGDDAHAAAAPPAMMAAELIKTSRRLSATRAAVLIRCVCMCFSSVTRHEEDAPAPTV